MTVTWRVLASRYGQFWNTEVVVSIAVEHDEDHYRTYGVGKLHLVCERLQCPQDLSLIL